jgi:outer membrane lipopolysaccharide assembly protein LptE/RlpB
MYVAFRSSQPDNETVQEVKEKLQNNNIDVSQLEDRPTNHCQPAESSAEGEYPHNPHGRRK